MELWQVILLAAVQGLTEFLPISSSGHLVIIEHLPFIDIETDLTLLNVTLHAGTLGSILVFYRKSILNLLRKERNVIWLLAIGTLPAIVAGLALEGTNNWRVSSLRPVAWCFAKWFHDCCRPVGRTETPRCGNFFFFARDPGDLFGDRL